MKRRSPQFLAVLVPPLFHPTHPPSWARSDTGIKKTCPTLAVAPRAANPTTQQSPAQMIGVRLQRRRHMASLQPRHSSIQLTHHHGQDPIPTSNSAPPPWPTQLAHKEPYLTLVYQPSCHRLAHTGAGVEDTTTNWKDYLDKAPTLSAHGKLKIPTLQK